MELDLLTRRKRKTHPDDVLEIVVARDVFDRDPAAPFCAFDGVNIHVFVIDGEAGDQLDLERVDLPHVFAELPIAFEFLAHFLGLSI